MARLFISYKREDRPRVKELAERLREAGHTVWYDESIQIGDHWWDKICEEIEACDVFIFAISQVALRSIPCQYERSYASALGKTVLLVQVGKLTAIPTEFATIQFGDFSHDDPRVLTGLLGAIHRAPPAPPIPSDVHRPDAPIAPLDEIAAILDTQAELNFEDQSALLFRLKALATDPHTRNEALRLVRQLLAKSQFVQIQTDCRALLPTQRWSRGWLVIGSVALVLVIGGLLIANTLNQPQSASTPTSATIVAALTTEAPTLATISPRNVQSLGSATPLSSATPLPTETEMSVEAILATGDAETATTIAQSWTPTITFTPTPNNAQRAATFRAITQTARSWTQTPSATSTATNTHTPTVSPTSTVTHTSTVQPPTTFRGHTKEVYCVAWSPDGKTIASASADRTVILWDVATRQNRHVLGNHTDWAGGVAWSPDSKLVGSSSGDNTVVVWDAQTFQRLATLSHQDDTRYLTWSPDGKTLATAGSDDVIMLWNVASWQRIRTLTGHKNIVNQVEWSPDGKSLVSASSGDYTVIVWDAATGQSLHTFTNHTNYVGNASWSPDGNLIASGGTDNTAIIWDAATGKIVRTLAGHTGSVTGVFWSPNGKLLATTSYDKTIRLWDAATGASLRTLTGHTNTVTWASWSPDSNMLASSSLDTTVILWDVHDLQ